MNIYEWITIGVCIFVTVVMYVIGKYFSKGLDNLIELKKQNDWGNK